MKKSLKYVLATLLFGFVQLVQAQKVTITGVVKDSLGVGLDMANVVAINEATKALDGFGCYERRDEAILRVIPDFDKKVDKAKIEIKQNTKEITISALLSTEMDIIGTYSAKSIYSAVGGRRV